MIEWIPGAIFQWWLVKKATPPPLVDYTREWQLFGWEYFKTVAPAGCYDMRDWK